MSTVWAFDNIANKHTFYRRKDCMKNICTSLKEQEERAIDFEKKILPLIKEESKSHQDKKLYCICQKRTLKKLSEIINFPEVRDHCHHIGRYRGTTHSICNLKFNVSNKIPVVFHSCSNYDYYLL